MLKKVPKGVILFRTKRKNKNVERVFDRSRRGDSHIMSVLEKILKDIIPLVIHICYVSFFNFPI